ncbi:hypothetical protein C0995_005949 [Termitomyces sp. Mi166|nr:hypothetical protein C0995_005949 [Termitomyces sp. Mi166\
MLQSSLWSLIVAPSALVIVVLAMPSPSAKVTGKLLIVDIVFLLILLLSGPSTVLNAEHLEIPATIISTGEGHPSTNALHVHHPHPSFVDCSFSQQKSVLEATKYLEDNNGTTPRYVTWFGAYDSLRYNIVKDHFRRISSPPNFPSFKYDCTCTKEGTWGHVIPDEFGIIYLCPTFWTLPVKGKESMAGSLVQKSSHFTRNGGTVDYVYTQPSCKALAISNATQAIYNADSHEYFAENDPALE